MRAKVFSISAGAPFIKTFVQALLDGDIIEGFSRRLSPLDIADATIYVPTRRAARALAEELAAALDRPATLMPRLLPLGALDATETSLLFTDNGMEPELDANLPVAASDIARRMLLTELVLKWGEVLRHAIVSVDADGQRRLDTSQPCLVGTSPVDAWYLAGELSGLIDELIIEDVGWTKLDPLVLPEFDSYWRITIDFLNIAIKQWPDILAAQGLVDAAKRRMALVDQQSALIRSGKAGPVIAIGSTGTNRATARLLAAIAQAPRGAVVLPGLDRHLDDAAWKAISASVSAGGEASDPCFGHPQAALARLLPILNVNRDGVTELGQAVPAMNLRGRFISEALRPADTTDLWRFYRDEIKEAELQEALAGLTLIEAADEREEALCLALALREVLSHPKKTAALVTPDRDLARRVKAELSRWGVEVDDSAGDVLSATQQGRLARLIANCTQEHLAILALLQHPLARFGLRRIAIEKLLPVYEIGLARTAIALDLSDPAGMIKAARAAARARSAHPAQRLITDEQWMALEALLRALSACLTPILGIHKADLPAWIAAHRQAFTRVSEGDDNSRCGGEDAEAIESLFDELGAYASKSITLDTEAYAHFFLQIANEIRVQGPVRAHPRVKIFGLLEARLMEADVMLLGGLDETVWPPQVQSDAFLNRPMRAELGLTPPERKIGQTAHDFTQAMGNREVVLSRAAKRGGTPTVPSRFIQRLTALGGAAWSPCLARGKAILALARLIDRPATAPKPVPRPLPRPPLDLRPTRLSVTRIEMLRRDPYAIYAEFILKLTELPAMSQTIELRHIGTAMHEAIAQFTQAYPSGPLPAESEAILTQQMQDACAVFFEDPQFATFRWRRIKQDIAFLLNFEAKRRESLHHIDVEIAGQLDILLQDGSAFTLTAMADRIEHLSNSHIAILDFKTGTPPSVKEVKVGFAPQLTLEAAMASRGAFGIAPNTHVKEALYLKLGGAKSFERSLIFEKPTLTLEEVAQKHYDELIALLNQLRDETQGYPSRPFPKYVARYNAYDHLARVKEWSLGESAETGS
jgi:ATP-dependent helicase/nuclease subunit B